MAGSWQCSSWPRRWRRFISACSWERGRPVRTEREARISFAAKGSSRRKHNCADVTSALPASTGSLRIRSTLCKASSTHKV